MTPTHKGFFIIVDGIGDRPVPHLGHKTPLEAADTPVLDQLARSGSSGLVDPLAPGIAVDTATGTGLLLGVPATAIDSLARGPVEAAGVGLEISPGDVALRCNFATVETATAGLSILDRRAGRIREGTEALASALEDVEVGDGITATIRAATQHRAVLRLSGAGLSAEISDTDPGVVPLPSPVLRSKALHRGDARASRTADALNRFIEYAHRTLSEHPINEARAGRGDAVANAIITRGAGLATTSRSIIEHVGLRSMVVAGESTVIGVANLLAMNSATDPRFTALPDTDLDAKVALAIASLEDHDLVFLHIKGADICSHDRDAPGKRDFLSRVDAAIAPLLDLDVVVGVIGDHSSDSATGNHSGEPVPALLTSPSGRMDQVEAFGETAASAGGLGRATASDYVRNFLSAMGAAMEWRPGTPPFDEPSRPWSS